LAGESAGYSYWLADAGRGLSKTAPPPIVQTSVSQLSTLASILSGPQPLSGIQDRGVGTLYLNHINDAPPYGVVPDEVLWRVAFPDDFQGARGASILAKKKVLASAARSSNSPWRFRVAVDERGVAMRNSTRGVAPHDQDDEGLLYALALIIGSGFASAFAAGFGGDRNIRADVLRALPIPTERSVLDELGVLGRQAAELAHDQAALHRHLLTSEQVVWDAYGVSEGDRSAAIARLAGHRAPEGSPRYPESAPEPRQRSSTFRRVGVVLNVIGNEALVWVNGVTPEEGVLVPFPAGMPGWLARAGATFDVTGVETVDDLAAGQFRFQRMAWQDLDLDNEFPKAILPG